jgi:hypothetical protein
MLVVSSSVLCLFVGDMCKAGWPVNTPLDVSSDYFTMMSEIFESDLLRFAPEHRIVPRRISSRKIYFARTAPGVVLLVAFFCYIYDIRRFVALFTVSFVFGLLVGLRHRW